MQDRILEGFLKAFVSEFGLTSLNESDAFERFVNHCVLSKHYADTIDPDEITVGGGGDLGLDGIGILVNDNLVFSPEDVDHFVKHLRRLDATFIFIQTKTSPRFEAADIGTFVAGVRRFFEHNLPVKCASDVRAFHRIKEHILSRVVDMDTSPRCLLYLCHNRNMDR